MASTNMPSSWCGEEVFQASPGQLNHFFDEVCALGSPQPRITLGGDWNVAMGSSTSRAELVEAWAEAHRLA